MTRPFTRTSLFSDPRSHLWIIQVNNKSGLFSLPCFASDLRIGCLPFSPPPKTNIPAAFFLALLFSSSSLFYVCPRPHKKQKRTSKLRGAFFFFFFFFFFSLERALFQLSPSHNGSNDSVLHTLQGSCLFFGQIESSEIHHNQTVLLTQCSYFYHHYHHHHHHHHHSHHCLRPDPQHSNCLYVI